jgi:GT2 family glycosyltransferase
MGMSKKQGISIIIPNYNGYDVLKRNIPLLVDAVENGNESAEIIVVDDASEDESIDFLNKFNYDIKVVEKRQNDGFAKTCNIGAKNAVGDILFFLNNDMAVKKPLLNPLYRLFDKNDIFAAAPSSLVKADGGIINETPIDGVWENGFLTILPKKNNNNELLDIFHTHGGCMMVRKDRFFELNCFDERFSPFYFEDVDLCWRARMKGWRIVHQPDVEIYHQSHYTIDRMYDNVYSNTVYWKNYFLFIMKNKKGIELHEIADYIYKHNRIGETVLLGFKIALRQYIRDFAI